MTWLDGAGVEITDCTRPTPLSGCRIIIDVYSDIHQRRSPASHARLVPGTGPCPDWSST